MRVFGPTISLALLLGVAVAAAQESPEIQPAPARPDVKAKSAHAAKTTKPVAPKISAPATVAPKTVAITSETIKLESSVDPVLSASDRLKIQSALLWSGDYTGSVNGDDPLISAIRNYQKRARSRITGVLSPVERTNLLAAAQLHGKTPW